MRIIIKTGQDGVLYRVEADVVARVRRAERVLAPEGDAVVSRVADVVAEDGLLRYEAVSQRNAVFRRMRAPDTHSQHRGLLLLSAPNTPEAQ